MPVPVMDTPVVDHQKQFQAAVDVIHNLPKNGSYRPSYEVMLRFYSLYKQAVCGPCTAPRPGFWDPVGRYKWDAWSHLGEMSSENAMAAYVDEIKKVAQEVIDTMPMNDKTASLFHHFEPLYLDIDDMPRPPGSLMALSEENKWSRVDDGAQCDWPYMKESVSIPTGLKDSESADSPEEEKTEEQPAPGEESSPQEDPDQPFSLAEVIDLTANSVHNDSGVSEGLVLTSDSESEIFCDSVDSVEQLTNIKIPVIKSNGFHNGHVSLESSGHLEARQVGAGQGGEGGSDGKGHDPHNRRRDGGRDASQRGWRERGVPQGSPRWGGPGGGGGGAGRGGGDGSEGGPERIHDTQLQQQIIVALRRLREDMRSVMERLEVVERLAATHAQGAEWRPCLQCAATASHQQEETWWPFDVSGQTVVLFLVWPFVAQGVVYLLKKAQKRSRISS